jgi:hypothetical protein
MRGSATDVMRYPKPSDMRESVRVVTYENGSCDLLVKVNDTQMGVCPVPSGQDATTHLLQVYLPIRQTTNRPWSSTSWQARGTVSSITSPLRHDQEARL